MDTQMKKGVLEMCILHTLRGEPLYGYELMKTIQACFPEVYEASVYAILRRLHQAGYADILRKASPTGPERKYYLLTDSGRAYLARMLEEWDRVRESVRAAGIL